MQYLVIEETRNGHLLGVSIAVGSTKQNARTVLNILSQEEEPPTVFSGVAWHTSQAAAQADASARVPDNAAPVPVLGYTNNTIEPRDPVTLHRLEREERMRA